MIKPIKLILILLLCTFTSIQIFAQKEKNFSNSSFDIDTIKSVSIKMERGSGLYFYDDDVADSGKNIFFIDKNMRGFFAISGQKDYIYVTRIAKQYLGNGEHKETFTGQGFTVVLISYTTDDRIFRYGSLDILNTKERKTLKVKGKVDYKF